MKRGATVAEIAALLCRLGAGPMGIELPDGGLMAVARKLRALDVGLDRPANS